VARCECGFNHFFFLFQKPVG
jgi:hypothetical protein